MCSKDRLSILILAPNFPPEICSASHLSYELAKYFVEKGHKVTTITGFPQIGENVVMQYKKRIFLREQMDGITVFRMPTILFPKKFPILRGFDQLSKALTFLLGGILSGKQDIIFSYSPPLFLGITCYLLSKIKKASFVFNVQDLWPQCAIDLGLLGNSLLIAFLQRVEKFIYKRAECITCHSIGNKDCIVSKGIEPHKVVVVPNWVDTDSIKPDRKDNEFSKKYHIDRFFVVSFAGVMGHSQDASTIIEAAYLLKDNKDILFLLAGEGIEKEKAERKAEKLGLRNVRFLPLQPKGMYPLLLNASDVCLVTLKKEVVTPVVPSKILSIMASGRPVIACLHSRDARDIIAEAQCGLCIEPENPELLARAVIELYKAPELRERMGKNGREYAERKFSRSSCLMRYEEIFSKVIGKDILR